MSFLNWAGDHPVLGVIFASMALSGWVLTVFIIGTALSPECLRCSGKDKD